MPRHVKNINSKILLLRGAVNTKSAAVCGYFRLKGGDIAATDDHKHNTPRGKLSLL